MKPQENGWEASASAWIADIGDQGDYARRYVLDQPMLERVRGRGFRTALDVGCGEGRFCRMLQAEGLETTGIEPAPTLLKAAQESDPKGRYLDAIAERIPAEAGAFDLVVSYMTLMDIDGVDLAIQEMARVLKPCGSLLIANLNSFNTAGSWQTQADGSRSFTLDDYLVERDEWVSWRGIKIRNWHRPFGTYMRLLLGAGLRLVHFDEPIPTSPDSAEDERYRRCPWAHIMEWQKA